MRWSFLLTYYAQFYRFLEKSFLKIASHLETAPLYQRSLLYFNFYSCLQNPSWAIAYYFDKVKQIALAFKQNLLNEYFEDYSS